MVREELKRAISVLSNNPYETREIDLKTVSQPGDRGSVHRSHLSTTWVFVFLFNLPLPILCASVVCKDQASLGIAIAVVLMFFAGLAFISLTRFRQTIVSGGVVLMLAQFLPLPQLIAGTIALEICKAMGLAKVDDLGVEQVDSVAGGFVASIFTGLFLLAAAAVIGLAVNTVFGWHRPSKSFENE